MADQPVQLAEATIPVKADLSEFQRQLDEVLQTLEQKLAEAADKAAKGFTEKIGGALDDIIAQIGKAEELAKGIETAQQQAPKPSEPHQQNDFSELGRKVDAIAAQMNEANNNLTLIVTKIGNN